MLDKQFLEFTMSSLEVFNSKYLNENLNTN